MIIFHLPKKFGIHVRLFGTFLFLLSCESRRFLECAKYQWLWQIRSALHSFPAHFFTTLDFGVTLPLYFPIIISSSNNFLLENILLRWIPTFLGKTEKTFFCHVDKSKIILMVKLTKNYFFPQVDFDKWFIFCLTGVVIGEKVKSGLSSSRLFTSCRNWVFSFLQAKPCHICLNKWHVSFCYCKLARSIFSLLMILEKKQQIPPSKTLIFHQQKKSFLFL